MLSFWASVPIHFLDFYLHLLPLKFLPAFKRWDTSLRRPSCALPPLIKAHVSCYGKSFEAFYTIRCHHLQRDRLSVFVDEYLSTVLQDLNRWDSRRRPSLFDPAVSIFFCYMFLFSSILLFFSLSLSPALPLFWYCTTIFWFSLHTYGYQVKIPIMKFTIYLHRASIMQAVQAVLSMPV